MRIRIYPLVTAGLLAALVVSGCRTYGGYGATRATYEQMQRSVSLFEEELGRARADLAAAEAAAAGNRYVETFAAKLAAIVDEYAATVEEQKELVASLSPDSDYRDVSRAFGAVDAEQETIRTQIGRLLQTYQTAFADTLAATHVDRPYAVIPPFYNRVASAERDPTVRDVLESVLSGRSPSIPIEMYEGGAEKESPQVPAGH